MLKPPENLVPNRLQTALTKRFLLPALPSVEAALLEIRAETDDPHHPPVEPQG